MLFPLHYTHKDVKSENSPIYFKSDFDLSECRNSLTAIIQINIRKVIPVKWVIPVKKVNYIS